MWGDDYLQPGMPEDDASVSTVGDIIALVERLVGAKA